MPLWAIYIIITLILMAIAYALTSTPKTPPQAPPKVETPVTEEGKIVGMVFGTEEISDPSVVEYWGLRIVKQKTPTAAKK
jgi:hypothetical protein